MYSKNCNKKIYKGRMSNTIFSNSGCIICWLQLNVAKGNRKSQNLEKKSQEIFKRFCSVLKVDASSFISSWNSESGSFPFCRYCSKDIHQLIHTQEKLEKIQKDLNEEISAIRQKLRESQPKCVSTDIRIINLRNQILGADIPVTTTTQQQNFCKNLNIFHSTNAPVSTDFVHHQPLKLTNSVAVSQHPTTYSLNSTIIPRNEIHNAGFSNFSTSNQEICQTMPSDSVQSINLGLVEVEVKLDESHTARQNAYQDAANNYQDIFDDQSQENYESSSESSDNEDSQENISIKKPQKTNNRKKRAVGASNNNLTMMGGKSRVPEYFSPLETTIDGRMIFENIEILKFPTGYACGNCKYDKVKGHSTIALRKMKIHIKGVHLDAYKCDKCSKKFTSGDIRNQHYKMVHLAGREPCKICGKPIRNHKNNWNYHLWSHKNEEEKAEARALGLEPAEIIREKNIVKKFQCDICGAAFAKPFRLRQHANTHLDPSLKKNIKCPHCDELFSHKTSLQSHIKVRHQETLNARWHTCLHCDKKFRNKTERDNHIARHHKSWNEKPFSCNICNQRFGLRVLMNKHMKKHRPASDYIVQCNICDLKIVSKDALRSHNRRYHPELSKSKQPIIKVELKDLRNKNSTEMEYLSDQNQTTGSNKRRKRSTAPLYNRDGTRRLRKEKLGPFDKNDGGKLTFEGYEVSKIRDGFDCVSCGSEFRPGSCKESSLPERAVKIHIRAVHLGAYTCKFCQKKCLSIPNLKAHIGYSHVLQISPCEICGKDVERKRNRNHLWSHKNIEEMVACINSGETIPHETKQLKNSIARSEDPSVSIVCVHCTESFSTAFELNEHKIERHPKTIQMLFRTNEQRKLGYLTDSDSDGETENPQSSSRSRRYKPTKRKVKNRKKYASSDTESDSDASESQSSDSDYNENNSSTRDTNKVTRLVDLRHSDPVILLNRLPKCLQSVQDIRIVSDNFVSYVNSPNEERQIIMIHQTEVKTEFPDAYYASDSDYMQELTNS